MSTGIRQYNGTALIVVQILVMGRQIMTKYEYYIDVFGGKIKQAKTEKAGKRFEIL